MQVGSSVVSAMLSVLDVSAWKARDREYSGDFGLTARNVGRVYEWDHRISVSLFGLQ